MPLPARCPICGSPTRRTVPGSLAAVLALATALLGALVVFLAVRVLTGAVLDADRVSALSTISGGCGFALAATWLFGRTRWRCARCGEV